MRGYQGQEAVLRVVKTDEDGVVLACRPEEWERAQTEGSHPLCIGVKPEYVVEFLADLKLAVAR